MDFSWLKTLLYGLVAGFTEILPVSARAHRTLLMHMLGMTGSPLLDFCTHLGTLLALILCCKTQIERLRREQALARIPKRRRKRQLDMRTFLDGQFIKTIAVPMTLGFLFYLKTEQWGARLNIIAVFLVLNGILLFLPLLMANGNKDSRSMSRLDGVFVGIVSALSVLPGVSLTGAAASMAVVRGADKQHALNWALLLNIPALALLMGFDLYFLFANGVGVIGFGVVVQYVLAGASAFCSAYFATLLMRFLAANLDYSGFAYYSWGAALFTFILYISI